MTMKLPRKLLSCLLVLAICITTVFGCLMTVSAAAASYAFGEGSVNEELTEAAINVTLTPPTDVATLANGTYMAEFMLNEVDTDGLVLQSVAVEAIAPNTIPLDTIGLSYNSEDLADGEIAYIELDCNAAFTSVTLKLTFGFSGGTAVKGNEYKMSIDSVTYTGRYEGETYTETASATGVIKTGCDHIITIDDQSVLVNTDSVNGYSVYTNSVCSVCGERFDYQVIPTAVPSDEKVIYWDGSVTSVSSFDELGGKGTSDEPYIIDSAADLALIAGATINSANLYFKVADGIDAIVLQSESVGAGILELTSASAVKDYFEDTSKTGFVEWVRGGWSTATPFIGSFDGNGVEIYGLYANTPNDTNPLAGLFTQIDAGAAISNVTVKNSYINSKSFAAFIAPYSGSDSQGLMTTGTVSFSQCIVANCYMVSNVDNSTNKAGIMTGTMNDYINMSNCLVYGNDANNVAVPYKDDSSIKGFKISLVGDLENVKDPVDSITNCICLGATPYPQYNVGYNNFVGPTASMFSNVYTDQPTEDISLYVYDSASAAYKYYNKAGQVIADSLTSVTATQVKTQDFVTTFNTNAGTEVLAVDVNGGYPTFAKEVAKIDDGGITNKWTYNDGDGSWSEDLRYDNVLADNGEKGDSWDTAIIIDSAEELAWLATRESDKGTEGTAGKYYKVADGITSFNMNDKIDLNGDMTAAEVESTIVNPKNWWNATFEGNFDGNGVTIYGLCANYGNNVGLFPVVKGNVTIKNVTVKNSYFYGDSVGVFYGYNSGATVTLENCVAHDNVVVSKRVNDANGYGGVVGGASSGALFVNNCLVYDNTAKHETYNIEYGLFGGSGSYTDTDGNTVYGKIENSIILGTLPHAISYSWSSVGHFNYSNIYSDKLNLTMTTGEHPCNVDTDGDKVTEIVQCYNTTTTSIDETTGKVAIKAVRHVVTTNTDYSVSTTKDAGSFIATTADDVTGLAASSVVTALNTANGSDVWAATANGYPTPMAAYADTINSVSSIDLNLKAVNLTYNNDGSFNLNFHYEPAYSGFEPQLYVAQADLSGFILNPTKSTYAGEGLSTEALMYTIENLSAREIGDTLLPTVVAANGNQALWGKTEQMSIADYAVAVINGEGYYTDTTDETIIQQDKNVAAAVINYGNAAKAALSQGYDGNAAGGVTWTYDGTPATAFSNPVGTGTADSPIIINSAKELAYLAQGADGNTAGKYYKIADGVSNIVLQKADYADEVMALGTTTEVEEYFNPTYATKTGTQLGAKNTALSQWATSTTARDKRFAGTFDGNGATIYGMYSYQNSSNGLFPNTGNVTVKNITIKNSYIYGDKVGFICGVASECGTVALENCSLYNNVGRVYRRNDSISAGGVLIGSNAGWGLVKDANNVAVGGEGYIETYGNNYANCFLNVNNCLIYGNSVRHQGWYDSGTEYDIDYSIFGGASGGVTVANSIILDNAPYSISYGWNQFYNASFTNVYTNMVGDTVTYIDYQSNGTSKIKYEITTTFEDDGISIDPVIKKYTNDTLSNTYTKTDYGTATTGLKKVTAAQVLGSAAAANMPDLDWSKWAYGMSGEYPTPVTSATTETVGKTLYYAGGAATSIANVGGGDGSSADSPIIIATAEELAYLVKSLGEESNGKYYKMADGIDKIIMQSQSHEAEILGITNADDAKTIINGYSDKKTWGAGSYTWNTTSSKFVTTGVFQGHFDGNGVEFYGLYGASGGLFPRVSVDATIKNLSIKNSYITSADKSGALVGSVDNGVDDLTDGATSYVNGNVTVDGVEISNCYVESTAYNSTTPSSTDRYRVGVLVGYFYNSSKLTGFIVNNCLVYGNKAVHVWQGTENTGELTVGGLMGSMDGGYNQEGEITYSVNTQIENSIILDCVPYSTKPESFANSARYENFNNIYTNCVDPKPYVTTLNWGSTWDKYENRINEVIASDMLGDKAADVVKAINDANGDSRDMYVGNAWGYPSFEKAGVMPTANQMAYDALTMSNYDEYTHTDPYFSMYATSLNLKTNPYIAFTFAFAGGTPDYKEDRDNITVTFKTASETITTKVGNGNGGLSDGWTNNEGAGRYHLYRLTGISVEDLCKDITVTVNYSDTDYTFGTFSAEGFALDIQNAYKQDPCQYYATRVEAAKALLYYTQMINARYGSIA